ncbi:MAG: zinc metallopeptidase [Coprococcus sp.]|nr:zinc metallopeptidase [Coprococcus sp.]
MYYPMYFDRTYFLIIIGVVLCMLASAKVNSTYAKYDRVRNHAGITGAMAAEQILRRAGIYDVQVQRVSGKLTDHYDPSNKVLRLSDSTYGSTSVAALGVAAHECGHAIQHAVHYAPLSIRGALVPVANFGSGISWPLILIGFVIRGEMAAIFIQIGILLFSAAVLFQIVTLPVEINASSRAMRILRESGLLYPQEADQARKVLSAAALTYVAGAASAVLQLLRILILTQGRRNDD